MLRFVLHHIPRSESAPSERMQSKKCMSFGMISSTIRCWLQCWLYKSIPKLESSWRCPDACKQNTANVNMNSKKRVDFYVCDPKIQYEKMHSKREGTPEIWTNTSKTLAKIQRKNADVPVG